MSVVKQEQHDLEVSVYLSRYDAGLQAMKAWLLMRQAKINSEWMGMTGEELFREQGEARAIAKILKMIDIGPAIKTT